MASVKANFVGLSGDNPNFVVKGQVIPNAYNGCFECEELTKKMIENDPEYKAFVIFEGEEGFVWSEKPLAGDMSKNKKLEDKYNEQALEYEKKNAEYQLLEERFEPVRANNEKLTAQVKTLTDERDTFEKAVKDLQQKLKEANAEIEKLKKPVKS